MGFAVHVAKYAILEFVSVIQKYASPSLVYRKPPRSTPRSRTEL